MTGIVADLVARPTLILLAALLVAGFARRRSAAWRHCLLATALVGAGLVAPVARMLTAHTIPLPERVLTFGAPAERAMAPPTLAVGKATTPLDVGQILLGVWLVGVAFGGLRLLVPLLRLQRLSSRSTPIEGGTWRSALNEASRWSDVGHRVWLLETDACGTLATWGITRPRILVPALALQWDEERVQRVLRHELAHIARHDWLVQLASDVTCTIYWFNPFFWLVARRLRFESERACDDAVLQAGVPSHEYAADLVAIARCAADAQPLSSAAIPMAGRSMLQRRISAMLKDRQTRQSLSRRAVLTVALVVAAFTGTLAALGAAQTNPRSFTGYVYDASGAVLPDVALTLTTEKQETVRVLTDQTGRFELPSVAPGRYVLEALLAGFRPLKQTIDLRADRDWDRDITLQVGDVQETIVITKPRLTSPTSAPPAVPIRVGGNIRPPHKTHDVPPVYPDTMRDAGLEGTVSIDAIIGRDGSVQSARVATAQVHPVFAKAALDAVRQWRFEPTLLNGEPVEVLMNVSVAFRLEN